MSDPAAAAEWAQTLAERQKARLDYYQKLHAQRTAATATTAAATLPDGDLKPAAKPTQAPVAAVPKQASASNPLEDMALAEEKAAWMKKRAEREIKKQWEKEFQKSRCEKQEEEQAKQTTRKEATAKRKKEQAETDQIHKIRREHAMTLTQDPAFKPKPKTKEIPKVTPNKPTEPTEPIAHGDVISPVLYNALFPNAPIADHGPPLAANYPRFNENEYMGEESNPKPSDVIIVDDTAKETDGNDSDSTSWSRHPQQMDNDDGSNEPDESQDLLAESQKY